MRFFLLLLFSSSLALAEDAGRYAHQFLPRLVQPLVFTRFTVSSINGQDAARSLMDEKIYAGTDDTNAYHFLSLNGTNVQCETVNQYRAAVKAGYTAQSTADISAESWFRQTDGVLSFLDRAKPSSASLFTAKDLKYLPVTLLNWNEREEGDWLKKKTGEGMTLADCNRIFAHHRIHSLKLKDGTLTFSDDGCDYVVSELARGDLDHDGSEDSLILVATYFTGGSGRYYQTFVVSKTDPKQKALKLTAFDH